MTNEADKTNASQSRHEGSPLQEVNTKAPATGNERSSTVRNVIMLLVAVVVVVALVASGIVPRLRDRKTLAAETTELAAPTVVAAIPKKGAPAEEILLPGGIQAFVDAPIYARTNGYLKHWYFDIGAHVRQGDLLADIESPEVDQQLTQAQADLQTAQANVHLSDITASRMTGLLKADAVSQQDTDNAVSDFAAKTTVVKSSQANVDRLKQLVSFRESLRTVRWRYHRTQHGYWTAYRLRCSRWPGALFISTGCGE